MPHTVSQLREIARQALLGATGRHGVGWSWDQLDALGWTERIEAWARSEHPALAPQPYLAGKFLARMVEDGHLPAEALRYGDGQ